MAPVFERERNGYNRQEVDMYVAKLRDEYEKVHYFCTKLQNRIHEEVSSNANQDDIACVMIAAQRFAREIRQDAQESAERMVAKAKSRAGHMISEALDRAEQIMKHAEQSRDEVKNQLQEILETLSQANGRDDACEGDINISYAQAAVASPPSGFYHADPGFGYHPDKHAGVVRF